jgi:hypothetical protein
MPVILPSKYFAIIRHLFLALTLVLNFVVPAWANDGNLSTKLDTIAASSGSNGIVDYIKQTTATNKAEDWLTMLDWLQGRLIKKDPDPFYSLIYSDILSNTAESMRMAHYASDKVRGMYANSYAQLRTFEMVARIDAARCADPSIAERIPTAIGNRYANFKDIKKEFTSEDWKSISEIPVMYEGIIANRPPHKKLCASGIQAMQAALAKNGDHLSENKDPDNLGKHFTVKPDANYEPKYISDTDWQKKRQEIIQQFKERLPQEQKNKGA